MARNPRNDKYLRLLLCKRLQRAAIDCTGDGPTALYGPSFSPPYGPPGFRVRSCTVARLQGGTEPPPSLTTAVSSQTVRPPFESPTQPFDHRIPGSLVAESPREMYSKECQSNQSGGNACTGEMLVGLTPWLVQAGRSGGPSGGWLAQPGRKHTSAAILLGSG